MLPADLDIEANRAEAAKILAPFLVLSNHMIFNFDEIDLKTALKSTVHVLLDATKQFEFSRLKEDRTTDLHHAVSNVMPELFFTSCFCVKDLRTQFKLGSSIEEKKLWSEGQALDTAIHNFFELSVEEEFYGLFKKRFLITPSTTSTWEAQSVSDVNSGGTPLGNELVERVWPKIFDDVHVKRWKDFHSYIDTFICLEFLKTVFEDD